MQTAGTNLNLLGAQSYTQNFVDQLKANAAGQQNPWLSLLSAGLGGAANALSKNIVPAGPSSDMSAASLYGGAATTPSSYLNQGGYLVNTPGT